MKKARSISTYEINIIYTQTQAHINYETKLMYHARKKDELHGNVSRRVVVILELVRHDAAQGFPILSLMT